MIGRGDFLGVHEELQRLILRARFCDWLVREAVAGRRCLSQCGYLGRRLTASHPTWPQRNAGLVYEETHEC